MVALRLHLLLAAAVLCTPAHALVLYKSVGPNGVVEFSDVPPSGEAKIIEQRNLRSAPSSGMPESAPLRPASMETLITDDEVARATTQVDLAEHALALARRGVWSPVEGLRLNGPSRTASDEQRIEFYKRNVLAARQQLLETLKQRFTAVASR
jgi:hypothetical protein